MPVSSFLFVTQFGILKKWYVHNTWYISTNRYQIETRVTTRCLSFSSVTLFQRSLVMQNYIHVPTPQWYLTLILIRVYRWNDVLALNHPWIITMIPNSNSDSTLSVEWCSSRYKPPMNYHFYDFCYILTCNRKKCGTSRRYSRRSIQRCLLSNLTQFFAST